MNPPEEQPISPTALPQAAMLYQRLLDLSLEGLLRVDADDRITYTNARMAERVGWTTGELEGRPVYDLLFPEDAERARERRAARRQGEREQYEARLRCEGGGECWVIARVSTVEEDGACAGTFSLMTDITERRQAEEALRRSEQDLQLAVDAARLGTFYCEWPFDKILWNETCLHHFFLEPDTEVDFALFYSLLHPDDREKTRAAIDRAIEERVEYNVEYRALAPDGRTRWINAVGRGRYDDNGVPVRFDGITMDITRRKEAERELAASFERERLVNRISQAIRARRRDRRCLGQGSGGRRPACHSPKHAARRPVPIPRARPRADGPELHRDHPRSASGLRHPLCRPV